MLTLVLLIKTTKIMKKMEWLYKLQREVKASLTDNWKFVSQDILPGSVYEKYIDWTTGKIVIIHFIKSSNAWGAYFLDTKKFQQEK